MTVGDLIRHLSEFPSDMPVLEQRYSDLGVMQTTSWGTVEAVEQPGREWLMQVTNRNVDRSIYGDRIKTYVVYWGN